MVKVISSTSSSSERKKERKTVCEKTDYANFVVDVFELLAGQFL